MIERDELIEKICSIVSASLKSATLLNWFDPDNDHSLLIDHLSSGDTIESGNAEIENLVEQVSEQFMADFALSVKKEIRYPEKVIGRKYSFSYICGWDDCIDEMKKLNEPPRKEEGE